MLAKYEPFVHKTAHTTAYKYKNIHNLPHWHAEHELIFVHQGEAFVYINNNIYNLKTGMGIFIKGKDIHYIVSDKKSVVYVIKTHALALNDILSNKRLKNPVIENTEGMENIFLNIEKEFKNQELYSSIITDSIITCFVANIFRSNETTDDFSKKLTNEKYKSLLKWLAERFASITFEEAAEFMGFSKPYFSKYFEKFSGMTFTEYMNVLKISAAIEKMSEKKHSITEISISCGFNTIRHFNRVFKNLTGFTPSTLPDEYVFIYNKRAEQGFDPTLSCTEII